MCLKGLLQPFKKKCHPSFPFQMIYPILARYGGWVLSFLLASSWLAMYVTVYRPALAGAAETNSMRRRLRNANQSRIANDGNHTGRTMVSPQGSS